MSDCLFCRIVLREIPAHVLYEDADVLAFRDVQPQAPIHILVVPKKHVAKLMDLSGSDDALVGAIHRAIQEVARRQAIDQSGFRVAVNNGPDAGQAVSHLHYHVLGGRKMGWPPG